MRIRELEIENFGVFRNRQFQFEPGVQIVYGQNEAGKTTLLELVRQLLFGFPHRNAYAINDHHGPLCAKATVEMADGQRVWFRRRKGRPDRVAGEIEDNRRVTEVDQRWLTAALGKATGELYKNVFGFSLKELADGTESLRDANLTEALYGGGIGNIANVQRVRSSLASETKRLFNTRSAKSEIRRLLEQIDEDQQDWHNAQVSPAQHREMLADQINADQEVDALKQQRKELGQQANQRRCQLDALAIHRQLLKATKELANLPAAAVDENAPKRFEWLRKQAVQHAKAIAELETAIQRCESEVASLPPDGTYSAESETIQKLYQQVAHLRSYREDQPRRYQESESIREAVLAQLQQIHPDWTDDSLQRLQMGVEQLNSVQTLSESRIRLDSQRSQVKSQMKELRRQAAHWRKIVDTENEDTSGLETAAGLASEYTDHQVNSTRLNENVLSELRLAEQQLADCSKSLSRIPQWQDATLPSAMPSDEIVASAKMTRAELAKQSNQIQSEMARAQTRLTEAQRQLDQLNESADAPDVNVLAQVRKRRDDGLRLLEELLESPDESTLQRWREWTGGHDDAASWDAIRNAIEGADLVADELLDAADIVAQRKELDRDIQLATTQIEDFAKQDRESTQNQAAGERTWREAWAPCGLEPLTPDEMTTWAGEYRHWTQLNDSVLRLRAKRDSLQTRIDSYESQWADLLSAAGVSNRLENEAPTSFATAGVAWWRERAEVIQQREVAHRELPDAESRLEAASHSLQGKEAELEKWAESWSKLLIELELPPHWEPQLVQRVFQTLGDATSRLKASASLSKRASDMQKQLDAAEVEVNAVVERLGVTVCSMPVDARIAHLYTSLEDERNGQQQKRLLTSQRDDAARRLEQRRQESEQTASEIRELQERLDASDEAEMTLRLKAVKQRADVQRSIDKSKELLADLAGRAQAADVDEFQRQLEQTDEQPMREAVQGDGLRIKELEDAIEQAQRKAGAATAAIERLVESTEATQRARKLASDHAQLAQLVDRWAPMAFAGRLLEMSMKRFEREHQPALLRETAQLLEQLTGGRYVDVVRRIDEKQALAVKTRGGDFRTPVELSTGAREQLYLAIRLAYVQQYCQRSEPLPMVMDDILVNFDDNRAASALAALQNFSDGKQILFLTCHQRTIELARPLGIPVIELQSRDTEAMPIAVPPTSRPMPQPTRVSLDSVVPMPPSDPEADNAEQEKPDPPENRKVDPASSSDERTPRDIQRDLF